MKKLGFLFMVIALLAATTAVFADPSKVPNPYDQHKGDDGIVTWDAIGSKYNNLSFDRGQEYKDVNSNTQSVNLKLKAEAYIPCYIKLELNGNEGAAGLESFGPYAHANLPTWYNNVNFYILFDNEVGGFVDGTWKSLGHGKNAQIAPGSNTYIQACDAFKVYVYSNDNFKYVIKGSSLANQDWVGLTGAQKWLPVEVGSSDTLNGTYDAQPLGQGTNNSVEKETLIYTGAACSGVTKFHKFRVPYGTDVAHGKYEGTITFSAYTI